jgi:hypothetical protein
MLMRETDGIRFGVFREAEGLPRTSYCRLTPANATGESGIPSRSPSTCLYLACLYLDG